jgi:UTP--glucose-1-phosphate uridylyltransferase
LRSDVYRVLDDFRVEPIPERASELPYVELDPRYYKLMDAFERRFPDGPPSLREAERLIVHGDVTFGAGVVVKGAVELSAPEPLTLAPGTVLS